MNRILQNLESLSTFIIKLIMLSQRKKKSLQHPWVDIFNERGLGFAATQVAPGLMTQPQHIHWTDISPSLPARLQRSPSLPQPPRSPPEFLRGLTTSLAEMLGSGCPFPLLWPWQHLPAWTTVPHLSKRGLHLNTDVLEPPQLELQGSTFWRINQQHAFSQFHNFKVHILSLLMRTIYTGRPQGRNVITLLMCAQTV